MIQLTQLACDAQWRPETIHLNQPSSSVIKASPLLSSSKISFSKPDSSISIPGELLQLPVHLDIPERRKTANNADTDNNIEFANSIRNIINTYSLSKNTSIEETAEIAEMSVRTLQRRLSDHGLRFNELLSEAKFTHAKMKLKTTEMSVIEVARSLGYSDAAHFTRAFKRWAGVTPSDFRKETSKSS